MILLEQSQQIESQHQLTFTSLESSFVMLQSICSFQKVQIKELEQATQLL